MSTVKSEESGGIYVVTRYRMHGMHTDPNRDTIA